MMSYTQNNLRPNEKVLFSTRVHPVVFLPSIGFFVATILVFFVSFDRSIMIPSFGVIPARSDGMVLLGMFLLPFSCALFLCTLLLGFQAIASLLTTEFAMTNQRIIVKTGMIRKHIGEILLPDVESSVVNQNGFGKLLNFGTVIITGPDGAKESFKTIAQPLAVKQRIDQTVERYLRAYAEFQRKQALLGK
jgi:uncharacterized membrane protein YdbT with pleckstrin-like domain